MYSLIALATGFILDLIIGDPIAGRISCWVTVKMIPFFERVLRRAFPATVSAS